jgi:excisionase family DNA binding protein
MSIAHDHRLEPSEIPPEVLGRIGDLVRTPQGAALVGAEGERVELPAALASLLGFIVEAMRRKQAVFVMPEDVALTTQAAARLLGVSRPYLARLLDAGRIAFHRVGSHRRVLLSDVRAFQATRDAERRSRLEALTQAVHQAGVYDRS